MKGWKTYENVHFLLIIFGFPYGSILRAIGPLLEGIWCLRREELQHQLLGDLRHFVFHLLPID
jgi:hypothetical protein